VRGKRDTGSSGGAERSGRRAGVSSSSEGVSTSRGEGRDTGGRAHARGIREAVGQACTEAKGTRAGFAFDLGVVDAIVERVVDLVEDALRAEVRRALLHEGLRNGEEEATGGGEEEATGGGEEDRLDSAPEGRGEGLC